MMRRLRVLVFGCPVCRHHWRHLKFCRYGRWPRPPYEPLRPNG